MTIFYYIEKYASEYPNEIVFFNNNQYITYRELYYILAEKQQTENRYKNKVVLLKQESVLEFVIAFLYLLSENCIVIPVHKEIKNRELNELLLGVNYVDFDYNAINDMTFLQNRKKQLILRKPSAMEAKIYHITSGSTGKSKLCIRTLLSLTKEGLAYKDCLKLTHKDRVLSLCPLHHSYALGVAVMGTLVSASALYLEEKLSPRKSIRTVLEREITVLILVPVIAKLMCEVKRKEIRPLSNVRIALTGAGVVDYELFHKFHHEFGVYLHGNYGSTETGGLLSRIEKETFPSLGHPMKGVQIKICYENDQDSYGELYVKSEGMFLGYVNQKDKVFDSDGFYAMGDYVSKDDDGTIIYKGRKKHIINIGGKKISPEEVAAVICKYAGVQDCIVTEHQRKNQRTIVVAFILADHEEPKALYQHCVNQLSQYKVPSIFHFIKEIPRNAMGKTKLHDLIKLLSDC